MRLRKSDIKAAEFTGHLDPWLLRDGIVSASVVEAHFDRKLKAMGYTYHYKRRPKSWKYGKYLMTLRRRIYLGTRASWAEKSPEDQAALKAHEHGHAVRIRDVLGWFTKYAMRPRFRFSEEAACYRQQVRAYRRMGYSEDVLADYAHKKGRSFPAGYWIFSRRLRKDIAREMPRIMLMDGGES